MLIFFTSSLRLSLDELKNYAKDWKMVVLTSLFMLVFLPVAMWLPPRIFAPDWALPFLIVGAMPTGMTNSVDRGILRRKNDACARHYRFTSLACAVHDPTCFPIPHWQNSSDSCAETFSRPSIHDRPAVRRRRVCTTQSEKFVKKTRFLVAANFHYRVWRSGSRNRC